MTNEPENHQVASFVKVTHPNPHSVPDCKYLASQTCRHTCDNFPYIHTYSTFNPPPKFGHNICICYSDAILMCVQISSVFGGREFCVVNGSQEFSKEDMEKKIFEVRMLSLLFNFRLSLSLPPSLPPSLPQHGGSLVANPGSETFCVLVGKLIVRANNIIR